jgi:hypothetical protein
LREAISFAASSSGESVGEGWRGSAGTEEREESRGVVSVGEGVCGCLALTFEEDIYPTLQQKGEKFEKKVKRSEVRPLFFTQGGWVYAQPFFGRVIF